MADVSTGLYDLVSVVYFIVIVIFGQYIQPNVECFCVFPEFKLQNSLEFIANLI
jgi:hypothetical protein